MAEPSLLKPSRKLTWRSWRVLFTVLVIMPALLWTFRIPLTRLFPIKHTGEVERIATFNKGGWSSKNENTKQLNQFALIFKDGFQCEGYDTSFAAVKPGDVINIRGYHDVGGMPIMDPEWWECDEAQLVGLVNIAE